MTTADIAAQLLQDLPPLQEAARAADATTEEARAAVAALRDHLGNQEAAVGADALDDPNLKNDAQRKAAVQKALQACPVLGKLRGDLVAAQRALAAAEVDQRDVERRLKGVAHSMTLCAAQLAREGYADFNAGAQANLRARMHKP